MKKTIGFLIFCSFVLFFFAQPALAWKQKENECLASNCVSGWAAIDTPYGGRNISALAMRSPTLMIAGNDSGVYRANFANIYNTPTWLLLSSMHVTSLAIYVDSIRADTIIYAGTNGRGLLKIKMYTSTLRSPSKGAKGVSLNPLLFVWPASVGPAPYNLQVASDSIFNIWIFSNNSNNTNYMFNYNTLLPLTTYYWRVLGYGQGGSTWSPIWSFTTACSTCTGTTLMSQPDSVIITGTGLTDMYVRAVTTDPKGLFYVISSATPNGDYIASCSIDSGKTWTSMGRPRSISPGSMTSLAIDSKGTIFAGSDSGIFRYNAGTWDTVSTGPADKHIHALASDDNNHLFAGTDQGAYFSTDEGAGWYLIGSMGLPGKITALAAGSPGPMTPLVGTETGLFEYIATTPGIKPAKQFPLEFPSGRSLRFTITAGPKMVDLRVYDARGAERIRLIHGELSTGTHEIRLDESRFHSGIYYIQLKTALAVETRIMVIAR